MGNRWVVKASAGNGGKDVWVMNKSNMNSIIAEAVNAAGLHYFNLDRGFSLVDKAVQSGLDNNGIPKTDDILAIIQEIEESYIEPDVEEE